MQAAEGDAFQDWDLEDVHPTLSTYGGSLLMHRLSLRRGEGFPVSSCHAEGSEASGRLLTLTL